MALCADLPALRSADLDAARARVEKGPAFVADADSTGTTLYTASSAAFHPRFGEGSRAAHAGDGVRELVGEWPTLRRDVDDTAGLRAAVELGVGPATARALAGLELG